VTCPSLRSGRLVTVALLRPLSVDSEPGRPVSGAPEHKFIVAVAVSTRSTPSTRTRTLRSTGLLSMQKRRHSRPYASEGDIERADDGGGQARTPFGVFDVRGPTSKGDSPWE
jgi:hypothetical protein